MPVESCIYEKLRHSISILGEDSCVRDASICNLFPCDIREIASTSPFIISMVEELGIC